MINKALLNNSFIEYKNKMYPGGSQVNAGEFPR
jgi:hypothetical protein